MSRAARFTAPAQETFSEFPITPTRLMVSANVFNHCQEFLIAGRPRHRRLGESPPAQARLGRDEFLQLAQYALVNRCVTNHAGAFVGLSLSGFELWFD